jgi:sterol-4alpha-carboxylate 3-dehydrogenase (decarboxylating)
MKPTILVTGGNGFLGSSLVRELKSSSQFPEANLKVFDLHDHTDHTSVEYFQGDIRDSGRVDEAVKGCDIVIHSAAVVDWGTRSPEEVMAINYNGTKRVLSACKKYGVKVMVFTSTLDAVYTGEPLVDVDESTPYPEKPHNAYCKSKSMAEQLVMDANNGSLKTAVIRPADVWGEGDPYHIGSLIDMAKSGFYVRLGNGKSRCQHVYVGNVANAHLQLARTLLDGNTQAEGSVYFITDPGSHNFFTFFDRIVVDSGYRIWPKNLWIPYGIAHLMASVSEGVAYLWRPIKHYHPKFSRFAVDYTCTDFTFTSEKAQREFAYIPKYGLEESIIRTVEYYRSERSD